jgi:hypothetical protein
MAQYSGTHLDETMKCQTRQRSPFRLRERHKVDRLSSLLLPTHQLSSLITANVFKGSLQPAAICTLYFEGLVNLHQQLSMNNVEPLVSTTVGASTAARVSVVDINAPLLGSEFSVKSERAAGARCPENSPIEFSATPKNQFVAAKDIRAATPQMAISERIARLTDFQMGCQTGPAPCLMRGI